MSRRRRARHVVPRLTTQSATQTTTRTRAIAQTAAATGAAVIVAAGAGALGVPAAHAAASLPLTLSASGSQTYAHFNRAGDLYLQAGAGSTYVQATVGLAALGSATAPAAPPSFTVLQHGADLKPRWVIELANGNEIDGYSTLIGGTAAADFTGDQWTEDNGTSYETYQQALSDAGDAQGAVTVTNAYLYAAGTGTAEINDIQYDGETPDVAPVTITPIPAQTVTANAPAAPVQVHATSSGVPSTVTYSATGLPDGLSINSSTGVISGTPVPLGTAPSTYTATITVADAFDIGAAATVTYTMNQPICSELTGCSWQRFADPSGMAMDVKGQTPHVGTPIIAWAPSLSDPAVDFSAYSTGNGDFELIRYTPYGTRATAEKDNPALAAAAYNSNGSAKYCVSAVADKTGQPLQLRLCATKANEWQDFLPEATGPNRDDSMYEPTYGQAGVSAGSHPMAINDKAYGGDGTPLINYPASGSGNENILLWIE